MSLRLAIIDENSGMVKGVIRASTGAKAHAGTFLVTVPPGMNLTTQWAWDVTSGFYPGPDLQKKMDAEDAAAESEGLEF